MALEKRYDPSEAEPRLQQWWTENKIFATNWDSGKPLFTIDTPPPTLSGKMHLGHAFSYTQGDFIARFHRMQDEEVFYPFGTDDNGLPTERLIEKQKGISSSKMSRKDFIEVVTSEVDRQLDAFAADWKRVGISADFANAYSTISPHSIKTSQKSFLDLFSKGVVYRKLTPISWDTAFQTAIAQAEFESVEQKSLLNDVAFTKDGQEFVISTSRPELIPACVALAANPNDARYNSLTNTSFTVPLSDRSVPLIFDDDVDVEFGTGLMMVCTFGDKEDIAKWHKHDLELRSIIGPNGRLLPLAGKYEGLKVKEARSQILDDLREANLLKGQKEIVHAVNVYERSGVEVEYLNTKQWFVNVLDFKEELLALGKELNWYPSFMHHRYQHWVENLNWDWCISRQRHYGVPFPVWYHKETGEIVVAEESDLPIDPQSQVPAAWNDRADELIPESDVMDTWATSSVSPQIALNWAGESQQFQNGFPMSIRRQAHDIIRTWAFYTIVKSMHHHGCLPWKDIVISGHALDPKGKKMSKSKGNVIDPAQVVTAFSADALRYWASSTKLGEDLSYQEKDIRTGHKTINKLWNASRFALMHLEDYVPSRPANMEVLDAWVMQEFSSAAQEAHKQFSDYEYSKAKAAIDDFFWNTFCDYYLEFVKDRLYNEERAEHKESAQFALYTVLLGVIKCFAPIMPHVTEEIYQQFFAQHEGVPSIHNSLWPVHEQDFDNDVHSAGALASKVLAQVRKFKSDNQLSLREELSELVVGCTSSERAVIESVIDDLASTARVKKITFVESDSLSVLIKN